MEGRAKFASASRIVGGQLLRVETGVGCASAAAGDAYFFRELSSKLEDGDACGRGSVSAAVIAAKNPAAPPPMMAISFISIGIFEDAYGDSNLVVVASGGFVRAAFAFESAKSSRLLAHAAAQLARAVGSPTDT